MRIALTLLLLFVVLAAAGGGMYVATLQTETTGGWRATPNLITGSGNLSTTGSATVGVLTVGGSSSDWGGTFFARTGSRMAFGGTSTSTASGGLAVGSMTCNGTLNARLTNRTAQYSSYVRGDGGGQYSLSQPVAGTCGEVAFKFVAYQGDGGFTNSVPFIASLPVSVLSGYAIVNTTNIDSSAITVSGAYVNFPACGGAIGVIIFKTL